MVQVHLDGVLRISPFSGAWVLERRDGTVYPLRGEVDSGLRDGDPVRVFGVVRHDLASIDMTGPVLDVDRVEKQQHSGSLS